jgi:hypothetical protein
MLSWLKNRQIRLVAIFALFVYVVGFWVWRSYGFPIGYQTCQQAADGHANYDSSAQNIYLIFLRKVGEIASDASFWNALITLFAVVVTAIATIYIARFTRVLADVTGTQAKLTRQSIDLARDEFISSHRPRIIVRALDFVGGTPESDEVEGPIRIGFHYVNAGDSLAKVKQVGTKLVHLLKPTMPTGIDFDVQKVDPPLEIQSGRHAFRITVDAFDQEKFIFNSAADNYSLVCVGYIVYSDENGTDRQVGFCRRFDGQSHRWLPMDDPEYEYSY